MNKQKSALEKIAEIPPINIMVLSGYGVWKLTAFFANKVADIFKQKK